MAIQDCLQRPPALQTISTHLTVLAVTYYECSAEDPCTAISSHHLIAYFI